MLETADVTTDPAARKRCSRLCSSAAASRAWKQRGNGRSLSQRGAVFIVDRSTIKFILIEGGRNYCRSCKPGWESTVRAQLTKRGVRVMLDNARAGRMRTGSIFKKRRAIFRGDDRYGARAVGPSPWYATLPIETRRGSYHRSEYVGYGQECLWAIGGLRAIPDPDAADGKPYPPTVATRDSRRPILAENIVARSGGETDDAVPLSFDRHDGVDGTDAASRIARQVFCSGLFRVAAVGAILFGALPGLDGACADVDWTLDYCFHAIFRITWCMRRRKKRITLIWTHARE